MPGRDLFERSEVQVFEFNPTGSNSPLCMSGIDDLPLHFLREINIQLGAAEHGDKPQWIPR